MDVGVVEIADLGLVTAAHLKTLAGRGTRVVLVLRATVPGARAAELALVGLGCDPAGVVVVGPRAWPRVVAASLGPRLRAVEDAGRLHRVPLVEGLAASGVTPAPLPGRLAKAARGLLPLIEPAAPVTPSVTPHNRRDS